MLALQQGGKGGGRSYHVWPYVLIFFMTRITFGGGGGGTPLHKPCRYVPAQRVGFLRRFGLKTGIHFTHFGPAVIGYGFQWNYDSVRTYLTPIE